MRRSMVQLSGLATLVILGLAACEKKNTAQEEEQKPQVFTPAAEEHLPRPDSAIAFDSSHTPASEPARPAGPAKLPTPAELKTVTPNQEAKRALTNDAGKAADLSFQEFGEYMKGRIPYYRGKGDLKFENDIVRIRINQTEMQIETQRGTLTFPMQ